MDSLKPGDQLTAGQELTSASGDYRLVMQGDGNLVLYELGGTPVWATNTSNVPPPHTPTHAVMQTDGNFVVYSDDGVPAWASGTNGGGDRHLVLQDDRNLVIYDDSGTAYWASNSTYTPAARVTFDKSDVVGYAKHMKTSGSLSNNGVLSADVFTQNKNWSTGLRGLVVAIVFDRHDNAIWVSTIFRADLRCSVPDPSCASSGQQSWIETFPEAIGKYASRVEVHQGEGQSIKNVRDQVIAVIKAAKDIAKEVKDVLGQLS